MVSNGEMDSAIAFGTAYTDGFLVIDIAGEEGVQRARHWGEQWFAFCMRQCMPFVVVLREPPVAAVRMDLRSVPGVTLTPELEIEIGRQVQCYGRQESQVRLETQTVSVLPVNLVLADCLADGLVKIGQRAVTLCAEMDS